MTLVPFSEWRPDIVDLDTNASQNILNVVPRGDGYGPFNALNAFTSALPSPCRGYFYARNNDGSISIFAGTATRLYLLNESTFTWIDVSKGAADYPALTSTDNWQFAQFNNLVFATQANAVLQVYNLASSSAFGDNPGSPPQARYIAVVSRCLMLSGLLSNPNRVQWSDLNDTTQWTAGVGQADFQDLPDGGATRGIAGGDQYGIIFQDARIRTITYAPGAPEVFDILAFPSTDGIFAAQSIINTNAGTFFASPQGFKLIPPGGVPTPIAKEKFDRTFLADVDAGNLQLMIGAADPATTRVYWAYKSLAGQAGLFDTVICYDWALKKATKLAVSGEYLATLSKPGITLEGLDTIATGTIAITGAANNGAGLIRLTIASEAYPVMPTPPDGAAVPTVLTTGSIVSVSGIVGTTEANAESWVITVVDPSHVDLQGSTFSNAYVSGGLVAGATDAMSFSLDSVSNATQASLSGISSAHALGFFNGPTLEGVMETPEQDGGGRRYFIAGLRPLTDASTSMCSVGHRDNAQAVTTYTSETAVNAVGICPQRVDTRYGRAKLRIPAGSTWTYAMGIEPTATPTGAR
jgi:hypothetical protein